MSRYISESKNERERKMKIRKNISFIMMVIMILTLFTSCSPKTSTPSTDAGSSGTDAKFEPMTIQLGHGDPPSDSDQYHKLATNFAENVSKATDGAVKIEVIPSGQLGGEYDMLEGFKMGTVDMAIFTANIFGTNYAPSAIIDLPFIFKDRETAYKFLDGPIEKEITDEIKDKLGVVVLGWGEGGFRNVLNNTRPIITPEDLKGIKLRVPETPIFVKTFNQLGANATPMAYSETFTGLQQKTIDGIELPVPSAYSGHYYDACKYMSMTGHFYNALTVSISKSKWDTLSPELQKIFAEAAVKAGNDQRTFVKDNEKDQIDKMIAAGLIVNDNVDKEAMREAVQPIYESYRDLIGAELYDKAMAAINAD
jgi:tripartite ATP-independent transporter DctP family solute receptor